MKRPRITVCLPVYQAEAFLERTLESLRGQTFDDFVALVSIDPSTDASEPICRDVAARDPRFVITVQQQRLGWIGNLNGLFDRVETELFFFLPHDDLLAPDYIEALYNEASQHPEAVNAFSDIRQVGVFEGTMESVAFDEPITKRLFAFLTEDMRSVPFRGLTRRRILDAGIRLRDNAHDGFAADVIFVLEALCVGPMRRVPRALYQRNEREDSVVRGWERQPRWWRLSAWADHIAQTLKILATAPLPEHERHVILCAALVRMLRQYWLGYGHYTAGGDSGHDELLLLSALMTRLMGDDPWTTATFNHLEHDESLRGFVGRLRYQEALVRIRQGDLPMAESLLRDAVKRDPGNAQAHRQFGIALRRRGQDDTGLHHLHEAVELAPYNVGCLTALADALAVRGDLTEAADIARRAVATAPEHPPAHFQLSHILARQGDIEAAVAAAKKAAALDTQASEYQEHLRLLTRARQS